MKGEGQYRASVLTHCYNIAACAGGINTLLEQAAEFHCLLQNYSEMKRRKPTSSKIGKIVFPAFHLSLIITKLL